MAQSLKLTPYRAWIYKAPGLIPFRSSPPIKSLELELINTRIHHMSGERTNTLFIPPAVASGLSHIVIALPAHCRCPDYVTNFLAQCANLESLTIAYARTGNRGDHDPSQHIPTTTFLKLHTLALWGLQPQILPTALHSLRTPALTHLTIRTGGYPSLKDLYSPAPRVIMDSIQSLGVLSPATSLLQSLTLWAEEDVTVRMGSEELSTILNSLPSLEHLSLNAIHFDAEEFLGASRSSPAFAPALEHLDLQRLDSEFQLQHILQFLKDRAVERGAGHGSESVRSGDFIRLTLSHGRLDAVLDDVYTTSPLLPELRALHGARISRTF
ncbi:hypothetical protein FA13DRAFT_1739518, partial [Coprinellus micaceus]